MYRELDLIGRFTEIAEIEGIFPMQAIDEAYKALFDPGSMTPEEYAGLSATHTARVVEAAKNLIKYAIRRSLVEPEKVHTWGVPPRLQFNSEEESLSLWFKQEGGNEHISVGRNAPGSLAKEITSVVYDSHYRYSWNDLTSPDNAEAASFQHFQINCIKQPTPKVLMYQRWKANIDNGVFTYFDKQVKRTYA